MSAPIKVFILGSCVSRDPFAMIEGHGFELVAYHARTSLASLAAPPHVDEKILDNIASAFQKRMVRADMEKTVLKEITNKPYDILLLDLIDERFNLAVHGESIHTRSSEYQSGLYQPNAYKSLGRFSNEKFELWKKGFAALVAAFRNRKAASKLVMNQVYLTTKSTLPPPHTSHNAQNIDETNAFLDRMYEHAVLTCPELHVLEYGENELIADTHHKWGYAPFHYVRAFAEKQLASLLDIQQLGQPQ